MTRITSEDGRLTLRVVGGGIDVERASGGRFSHAPQAIYERWDEFADWAANIGGDGDGDAPGRPARLGNPVPAPRQILGVGINYRSHVRNLGLKLPTAPAVFSRLVTSLTGPYGDIPVRGDAVFTEVEIAVVLKRAAHRVPAEKALDHLAGIVLAQDLIDPAAVVVSEDLRGERVGRYNLVAKSFAGFAPIGPELVSIDAAGPLDDIDLALDIDGRPFQRGNTSDMLFPIPELIARLTHDLHLLPGDLIFTGTPARVSGGEFERLTPGRVVTARARGLGEQKNHVTDATSTDRE